MAPLLPASGLARGTASRSDARQVSLRLVEDGEHYTEVVEQLAAARVSLWIATANLKDLRVAAPRGTVERARGRYVSVLSVLSTLRQRGVELRLLHAGRPSQAFLQERERHASLAAVSEWMRQCPRVHFKLIIIDGALLYTGSANFTGAGLGAKGAGRRNFELGFLTDDDFLLDEAQRRFDTVWSGGECASCRLRASCPQPLDA